MNFQTVTLNGQKVTKATGPCRKLKRILLYTATAGSTVAYSIITDYGSISQTWSKPVH